MSDSFSPMALVDKGQYFNPRYLFADQENETPYFKDQATPLKGEIDRIDSDWISRAFFVTRENLSKTTDELDVKNRYWSSASMKWASNKLGSSLGINARPGFTPYADLPGDSLLPQAKPPSVSFINTNYSLGRYYSEAIDDHAQVIYMRFGVPSYCSLLRFFTTAFDYNALSMVRTGSTSITHEIAKGVGVAALFVAFPVLALTGIALKWAANAFFGGLSTRFYTLKPTMHLYWATVNRLVSYIAVNKGFIPRNSPITPHGTEQKKDQGWRFDAADLTYMSDLLGEDVFTKDFGFDMFAIATKYQRLAMAYHEKLRELLESGSSDAYVGFVNHTDETMSQFRNLGKVSGRDMITAFDSALKLGGENKFYMEGQDGKSASVQGEGNGEYAVDTNTAPSPGDMENFTKTYGAEAQGFFDYFDAEFRDGSNFALFVVDNTGSVNESFTNSVQESSIASTVNSLSSTARDFKFALTAAASSIPGLSSLASTLEAAVAGGLGGLTFGLSNILFGLGTGFIDVPKMWSSSSSSMPGNTVNYTMQLVSPYGNPYSQMQNQIIPLCMIMAGGMPRATGSQSHGSPFICQLYDRGRVQIRVGMITSLTITRGTTNLGFSKGGIPMGIECQFKVDDMSTIMACPVTSGTMFNNALNMATAGILGSSTYIDEDNPLTDYFAVLAGMDIYSQIYPIEKAKLNWARNVMGTWNELHSPAAWASWVDDGMRSGVLNVLTCIPRGLVSGNAAVQSGGGTNF